MAELIIKSVPSGAEVRIDDEIIGTTPLTYPINEVVGLAEFRAECLSGEDVVCSWDVMKIRLEDQIVSRLWWDLTRDERHSIAVDSIINTLWDLSAIIRLGNQDCAGGEGDSGSTTCLANAIIRYLKFVSSDFTNIDRYYWRYGGTPEETETCWRPDVCYNLPGHVVSCMPLLDAQNHAMCGIQIDTDLNSINSWVVFNYDNYDIKPGDQQMADPFIRIWTPEHDGITTTLIGMSVAHIIISEFAV